MTEPATEPTTQEPTAPTTEPAAPAVPEVPPLAATAEPSAPDYSGLKLPDGYTADSPNIALLRELATAHKVPADALQAHIDALAKADAEAAVTSQQALKAQVEKWTAEVKADPDVGGAKYEENLAHARRWVKSYGGEELQALLDETGLSHHPGFLKALMLAGKDAGEAPMLRSDRSVAVDPARQRWPNSPRMWS
jgi:hypothetical protein